MDVLSQKVSLLFHALLHGCETSLHGKPTAAGPLQERLHLCAALGFRLWAVLYARAGGHRLWAHSWSIWLPAYGCLLMGGGAIVPLHPPAPPPPMPPRNIHVLGSQDVAKCSLDDFQEVWHPRLHTSSNWQAQHRQDGEQGPASQRAAMNCEEAAPILCNIPAVLNMLRQGQGLTASNCRPTAARL